VNRYDPDPHEPSGISPELMERLRSLRWPEASPEARQRCWAAMQRALAEADGAAPATAEGEPHADEVAVKGPAVVWLAPTEDAEASRRRRHEFAGGRGRDGSYTGALGERVSGARRRSRLLPV